MTSTFSATMESPAGPFTIVTDTDGAVLAAGWTTDVAALLTLVHTDLKKEAAPRRDLGPASAAAVGYFNGDLAAPDAVPVRQLSGEFRTHAWQVLREVKPGDPLTYQA